MGSENKFTVKGDGLQSTKENKNKTFITFDFINNSVLFLIGLIEVHVDTFVLVQLILEADAH